MKKGMLGNDMDNETNGSCAIYFSQPPPTNQDFIVHVGGLLVQIAESIMG